MAGKLILRAHAACLARTRPRRARGISSLCGTLDSFTPTDLKQLLISDSHQTAQLEEIERLDDVRDGWSRLAEAAPRGV